MKKTPYVYYYSKSKRIDSKITSGKKTVLSPIVKKNSGNKNSRSGESIEIQNNETTISYENYHEHMENTLGLDMRDINIVKLDIHSIAKNMNQTARHDRKRKHFWERGRERRPRKHSDSEKRKKKEELKRKKSEKKSQDLYDIKKKKRLSWKKGGSELRTKSPSRLRKTRKIRSTNSESPTVHTISNSPPEISDIKITKKQNVTNFNLFLEKAKENCPKRPRSSHINLNESDSPKHPNSTTTINIIDGEQKSPKLNAGGDILETEIKTKFTGDNLDSNPEKMKKSKSFSNFSLSDEDLKVILIHISEENNIDVPPNLDDIISELNLRNIFTLGDIKKLDRKTWNDISAEFPFKFAKLVRDYASRGLRPNHMVRKKSNNRTKNNRGKLSNTDGKRLQLRVISENSDSYERNPVPLKQLSNPQFRNIPLDSKIEIDESDEERVESSSESENSLSSLISNGRISTLAQLAAGLSLAGIEFGSDDTSGSDSSYSMPEELLNEGGLSLPEPDQWSIQTGDTVDITAKLGKGATATVWSGIIRNKLVAIKRIELKSFAEGIKYAQMAAQREYDIVRL